MNDHEKLKQFIDRYPDKIGQVVFPVHICFRNVYSENLKKTNASTV
jgi:hypothetical protein